MAEVFGVGRVVDYETHDDGTSHIEVLGRFRAPARRQSFARQCSGGRGDGPAGDGARRTPTRGRSRKTLQRAPAAPPPGPTPDAKEALDQILQSSSRDVPFLVHLLCTVVVGNPEVRQKLLEEDDVLDRGQRPADDARDPEPGARPSDRRGVIVERVFTTVTTGAHGGERDAEPWNSG